MFALAETYDPNMLAVWGSRGVTSDVVRARALYRKALELGVTKASMRLEALNTVPSESKTLPVVAPPAAPVTVPCEPKK